MTQFPNQLMPQPMTDVFQVSTALKNLLEAQGFSVAACLDLQSQNLDFDMMALEKWLAQGAHAQMHFMQENKQARHDSTFILAHARTAVSVLVPYATGERIRVGKGSPQGASYTSAIEPLPESLANRQLVARYARGKDYHKVIKNHFSAALEAFALKAPQSFTYRVVVDSIPFLDRAHARLAGLGFIGKNTMLIRPGLGSYFFIATALLSLTPQELCEPFGAAQNGETSNTSRANPIAKLDCGACQKCMDACPTQALPRPYFLDANKCLSYLSIEHRDVISEQYLPFFADTLYGCDICQQACPYNYSTLDLVRIKELRSVHPPLTQISVLKVARMSQQNYEEWFGGTAMTRAKYSGLVRNALYHLYAIQSPELLSVLTARTADPELLIAKTVAQLQRLLDA